MDIQPIAEVPALEFRGYIVVGDLHLGYEIELERKGSHISDLSERIIEQFLSLLQRGYRGAIILGDLKHTVPEYFNLEKRYIDRILKPLIDRDMEIHIFRGNHDGWISKMIPEHSNIHLHPSSGGIIEGVGFFHGHARPSDDVMNANMRIAAHIHPAVCMSGEKHRCWLRGDDMIIMPAFNRFLPGMCINLPHKITGVENIAGDRWKDMDVYLLNGLHLGKLVDIMHR